MVLVGRYGRGIGYTFKSLGVLGDPGSHGMAESGWVAVPVVVRDVVTAAGSIDDESPGSHFVRLLRKCVRKTAVDTERG